MKILIGGTIMKHKSSLSRSLITLLSVGVFAVSGFSATAQAKSRGPAEQPARLIINRMPNLGINVIVDLYLDGAPFGSVGYGQSFEKSLPAGRHVLSVQPTPNAKAGTGSALAVDARSGKTYVFTAEDNGSSLVLK